MIVAVGLGIDGYPINQPGTLVHNGRAQPLSGQEPKYVVGREVVKEGGTVAACDHQSSPIKARGVYSTSGWHSRHVDSSLQKTNYNLSMTAPIYLDHHATTPLDPSVLEAMMPYLTTRFGNAASTAHVFGWEAEEGVKLAREQLADAVGATPAEILRGNLRRHRSDQSGLEGCRRLVRGPTGPRHYPCNRARGDPRHLPLPRGPRGRADGVGRRCYGPGGPGSGRSRATARNPPIVRAPWQQRDWHLAARH